MSIIGDHLRDDCMRGAYSEDGESWIDYAAYSRLQVQNEHLAAGLAAAEEELYELRKANEKFGQRQKWWTEKMFELETERDELRAALKLAEEQSAELVAQLEDIKKFWVNATLKGSEE